MPFFAAAQVDLLFIEFPGIHLSHEMRVQLDYASHNWIHLHVFNEEKQVLFKDIFTREKFAGNHDIPTHAFFISASTFLTGFSASSCIPQTVRTLLVAGTLGDLVAVAIATILVASKQTQSLYIQ